MIKTLILKLGGAVALEDDTIAALAQGIPVLAASGVRLVIVHGGGPQIDRALAALGEASIKHKGLRVTSEAAAEVVRDQLDSIGALLTAKLTACGHAAVHLPSAAGVFQATKKTLDDGFDLGRVGTVAEIKAPAVTSEDAIIVVTPVGTDGHGPLNVNADEAAAALARCLHADRLLLATDVPHVLDGAGQPLPHLDLASCRALITSGAAHGGMIPKLEAALFALAAGVEDVLITRLGPDTLERAIEPIPTHGTRLTPSATAVEASA